jgi:hypothetical protein
VWGDGMNLGNEVGYAGNRPLVVGDPLGLLTILLVIGDDSNAVNFAIRNFEHAMDSYTDQDGVLIIRVTRGSSGDIEVSQEFVRPDGGLRARVAAANPGARLGSMALHHPVRFFVCGHGNRDGTFPDPEAARAGLQRAKFFLDIAGRVYGKVPDSAQLFSCYAGRVPDGADGARSLVNIVREVLPGIPTKADRGTPIQREWWNGRRPAPIDHIVEWSDPVTQ